MSTEETVKRVTVKRVRCKACSGQGWYLRGGATASCKSCGGEGETIEDEEEKV